MPETYFDEEEFESHFDGHTFRRILGLTLPHIKWVIGFLITIGLVAALDAIFTYMSKLIIDNGIVAKDSLYLVHILIIYASLVIVQAGAVFLFIYLAGILLTCSN
jgi:ATP-binding cassette subfamily B protein